MFPNAGSFGGARTRRSLGPRSLGRVQAAVGAPVAVARLPRAPPCYREEGLHPVIFNGAPSRSEPCSSPGAKVLHTVGEYVFTRIFVDSTMDNFSFGAGPEP